MGLAQRVARHARQRRVAKQIRSARAPRAANRQDPGPLLAWMPTVSPDLRSPTHLHPLADAVERGQVAGPRVHACFSVPVRHGKTTLVQHAIAWILTKDPTRRILYVSYAHSFAKKQTAAAKRLARKAGVVLGRSRRTDEWTTKAGGFVKAVGIGGQITGEGFTDVFIDDPHKNRAEAESRVIREGVAEAFISDIYTRQEVGGGTNIYVIHARWTIADLIGVLTSMEPHPFEAHNLPALNDNGEALAPWMFTSEQLEEIRDTVGPYVWASLYQGKPRRKGGTLFVDPTLAHLRTPREFKTCIGIDLARSSATRADYNAAVVMRKDLLTGTFDVLEAVRERGTVTDRVSGGELVDLGFANQLARLLREHPGATIAFYALELERPLVALLEAELSRLMGYTVTIAVMEIAGDKYLRAQSYAATWNRGHVRVPGRVSLVDPDEDDEMRRDGWQGPFVSEHVDFTGVRGQQDDMVDAGAAAHDYLNNGEEGTSLADAMKAAMAGR